MTPAGNKVVTPDYRGEGIANLMASLAQALGGEVTGYPPLSGIDTDMLSAAQHIVLLVVDGLGYQYLHDRGRGSRLQEHCIARLSSVCPSTTASAVPTFLTGLPPQQHGFTGWFTYFSELGATLAVLPFRHRLGFTPVDEAVLTPSDLSKAGSFFQRLPVAGHSLMPDWIAQSAFNRAFNGGGRIHGYNGLDGLAKKLVKIIKSSREPAFVSAYWPEFDALAHEFGVQSEEVDEHFQRLDLFFTDLMRRLRGQETLLLVTADHGFIDTSTTSRMKLADHPRLAEALLVPPCGEPRLPLCYVHPDRAEAFESYVREHLARQVALYPSEWLLKNGWFGLGEPHPRLHERIGHYALVMKENFTLCGRYPGERPRRHIGVHGGVSPEEMYVPLVYAVS